MTFQKKIEKYLLIPPYRDSATLPEITGCRIEFRDAENEFIFTTRRLAAWNFKT